jgi:hypothetical protein
MDYRIVKLCWHLLLLTFLLAGMFLVSRACLSAATPPPNWGPKLMPLADIQSRCDFNLIAPKYLPVGYKLVESRLVWVPRMPEIYPDLPSRQAVQLVYAKTNSQDTIYLVMVKHLPKINAYHNTQEVLSEGFFNIPIFDQRGTSLQYGTAHGADFVFVSRRLSDTEQNKIRASIALLPKPKLPVK